MHSFAAVHRQLIVHMQSNALQPAHEQDQTCQQATQPPTNGSYNMMHNRQLQVHVAGPSATNTPSNQLPQL
jgi:hypothetical protein